MTVDVVLAFIIVVLSWLGWRTGALGQIVRIVAALAVLFGGRIAAELVREVLFADSKWGGSVVADVAAYFLAVTLLYAAIIGIGWLVIRVMRAASTTLSTMDRAAGAGIGALKAAVLTYVVVWGCLLLQAPLAKLDPDDALHLRDGFATSLAAEYDVLSPWRLPELETLHRMVEAGAIARRENAEKIVRQFGKAADLLRRDDVRALVEDDVLVEAAESDRWAQTLADPRVRELLGDDEFVAAMSKVAWDEVLGALTPEAEPETEAPVEGSDDSGRSPTP